MQSAAKFIYKAKTNKLKKKITQKHKETCLFKKNSVWFYCCKEHCYLENDPRGKAEVKEFLAEGGEKHAGWHTAGKAVPSTGRTWLQGALEPHLPIALNNKRGRVDSAVVAAACSKLWLCPAAAKRAEGARKQGSSPSRTHECSSASHLAWGHPKSAKGLCLHDS